MACIPPNGLADTLRARFLITGRMDLTGWRTMECTR